MVLKRQTVWLLTMLSLIVVLSVYYIQMDRIEQQGALGDEEGQQNEEGVSEEGLDGLDWLNDSDELQFIELEDVEEVLGDGSFPDVDVDEMFTQIRLQRQDSRGRLRDDYVDVLTSAEANAEVQSQAFDQVTNLETLAQKEEMIETVLRSKGYEDALVIADENNVKIYVKADDLTEEQTLEIMALSYDHFGNKRAEVGFQPGN
ncbi:MULTISPECIES: SpoIIIAH-like family protein [Bacillaceae]|uniref:SpoIIIAH-like family protein n=1 Tax=Evansella alkalicola TaxID=745819 RepID=A0ABS6K2H1_9BACI|nr:MULTISPECIES: SpoIIIAH-like family protein [Bacillaceae]MBU9724167.1 SpoIIIAH-like family protein [Bacillus alkalicola]